MALIATPVCDFGQAAPDFNLLGVDGRHWCLSECMGENGLLVMFICNHCPYVKAVHERLIKDLLALKSLGIASVAIMSNDVEAYPEDSFDNMKRMSVLHQYPFPYLLDASQDVAKAYGAVCTPDFFGYNAHAELQYRGRLDASNKEAALEGSRRELFDAMQQVAETGKGPESQIPSIGCSIKWKA